MKDYYLLAQIYRYCSLTDISNLLLVNSQFRSDKWWRILTEVKFSEIRLVKPDDFPCVNWFFYLSIQKHYGFDRKSANKALMNDDILALATLLGCEINPDIIALSDYLIGNPKKETVCWLFKYLVNLRPIILDLIIKTDLINWLIPVLQKTQINLNLMAKILTVLDENSANNLIRSWFKIVPPNQEFLDLIVGLGFFEKAEYLTKMDIRPSEKAFIYAMRVDTKNFYSELEKKYNLKIKTEEDIDKFKEIAISMGALNFLKFGLTKDFSFDSFDIKRIFERKEEGIIIWAVDKLKIPKNKWKFMVDLESYSDEFIAHFIKLGYWVNADYILRLTELNYVRSLVNVN